ncbi:MAG: ribosome maturation factor RimP [Chitinivibrionales bacterium]|nr:ribosome maturation factor RimP [Chitinivibrionales bacterium]
MGAQPFFFIIESDCMLLNPEIKEHIENKIEHLGFELCDARFSGAGPHKVLRLYIDKDNGVTIDDCELVSNEVSILLDLEDFSQSPYRLEVSSPGIDRPLQGERDYQRSRGRRVALELSEAINGKKLITGEIRSAENGRVGLDTGKEEHAIPLEHIIRGKIEIQF